MNTTRQEAVNPDWCQPIRMLSRWMVNYSAWLADPSTTFESIRPIGAIGSRNSGPWEPTPSKREWKHDLITYPISFWIAQKPDWNTREVAQMGARLTTFTLPGSLLAIASAGSIEQQTKQIWIQICPNPFERGVERLAYYGKILIVLYFLNYSILNTFSSFNNRPDRNVLSRQRRRFDV